MPRRFSLQQHLLAFAMVSYAAQAVSGQSPESTPSDVHLSVRTRGGQLVFRVGEVIPLELSFSSATPKSYQLNMATYDRSGRLNAERFTVQPSSGWKDPLDLYFHSFGAVIGGGLRGFRVLSAEPIVIPLELNEWAQFNAPGQYSVAIASSRVSRLDATSGDRGVNVASNALSLVIVSPTETWQRETLTKALAALGELRSSTAIVNQPNPRRNAIKVLRYLGTNAAAGEMARRLREPECASDCMLGLVSSPAREAALAALKQLLIAPDFPVDDRFLSTMSIVALPENGVRDPIVQRQENEAKFRKDLGLALGTKRNEALAISAMTLLGSDAGSQGLPADVKRQATQQLIANFQKLPVQKQSEILQYRWKTLNHALMLPLLREVATRYQDFTQLREPGAYEFNNTSAVALQHWYEMEPDMARPAILEEILRPRPRFSAAVLGILPDGNLAEVEQPLLQHLRDTQDFDVASNLASLISRYATGAAEPQVRGYLDPQLGKLACAVQAPLLAYLLKHSSASAQPAIETAMAARGRGFSACNHSLLQDVSQLQNDNFLEDVAHASLDDHDPQVVSSAASYLGRSGSASTEETLWAHLIVWNQNWAGREAELRNIPGGSLDGVYQAGAGTKMIQSLATGHNWLTDESKLRRLVRLSVDSQQRQKVEGYLETWLQLPRTIQFIPFEHGQFQIAQYHESSLQGAKEKLEEFPKGSKFVWIGDPVQEGEKQAFRELSHFAAERGIEIARDLK